jgi:hypothetical protein
MVADTADRLFADAAAHGVSIDERLRQGLIVLEKLTQPEVARSVTALIELAPQAPGMLAMAMDSADDLVAAAARNGIDIEQFGRSSANAVKTLLECGMLSPETLAILGHIAIALQSAQPQRVGPMGILRSLSDPEVQLAIGFLLSVAKHLGKRLSEEPNHTITQG